MLKYLTAGLVAASLIAAPALATTASAAQTTVKVLTTQPVAKVLIVKHKRFAHFPRKHIKHVRVWHPHKKHVTHVRHGNVVKFFVKKPVKIVVKKTIITR